MPNVTYYSFYDLMFYLKNYYQPTYNYSPYTASQCPLTAFVSSVKSEYNGLELPSGYINTNTSELFKQLYNRYNGNAIIKISEDETPKDYYKKWIYNLYNMIIMTYEKYEEIITYFTAAKTHLMDQISSGNDYTTRFNDTPMDGGAFDDDNHTTNITEFSSSSGTDGDTKVSRLAEINSKLDDYFKKWTDEFEKIFIEEEV